MVICFRILTGRKKTAVYYKMFSNAKPDSIFGRLSSLVSKDDKETGLGEAIGQLLASFQPLYSYSFSTNHLTKTAHVDHQTFVLEYVS